MIFELIFKDKKEYCQAKNTLHCLQEHHREYDDLFEIEEIKIISEEDAKTIIIINTEYDEEIEGSEPEIILNDLVVGDDFVIIGSSDWI